MYNKLLLIQYCIPFKTETIQLNFLLKNVLNGIMFKINLLHDIPSPHTHTLSLVYISVLQKLSKRGNDDVVISANNPLQLFTHSSTTPNHSSLST